MGLRYRKNVKTVVGRPDVAFCGLRVAVFVDGDYWHGRILQQSGLQALPALTGVLHRTSAMY